MNYLVFDIGGTTIKYSLMDEDAHFLDKHEVSTPIQGEGKTLPLLLEIIKEYQNKHQISGVALSVPGGIDDDGYIHFMGSVTDLIGINLKQIIQEETGLPSAYDNDVNCVALAEKFKGNAVNNRNFVCITIGTGIGGGIFMNGELYRGNRGMAGECGIMLLNNGMGLSTEEMESNWYSGLASTAALVRKSAAINTEIATGKDVFKQAEQGNEAIQQEIDKFYYSLAVGIHNLFYTLAPEKVLIGGGVSEREDLIENVKHYVGLLRKDTLDFLEIDRCKFKNDAGKIGALYLLLKN